jgi:hypothetical protein
MPKVRFETGQVVNFETTPTQKDIDEVAQKLGITKQPTAPVAPQEPTSQNIFDPLQKKNDSFFGGILRSTIGSEGLVGVGQLPGRVVATGIYGNQLTGASRMVQESKMRLAGVTDKLVQKVQELPENDPRRQNLLSIIQENFKTMGVSDEELQNITQGLQERIITPGQAIGTGINAALTVGSGLGRTPVLVAEHFFRAAGTRALQSGAIFGGFTTAEGLINDKPIDEIAKQAAISFGIGALGSGLFSLAVTAPIRALTGDKTVARIFRSGLGFGKAAQKAEERQNKLASEILIKEGAGTADQLKQKYHALAQESEAGIQKEIRNFLRSTGKGGTFESGQVLREVESAYRAQFPFSLGRGEIDAFMKTLPLDVLRRKPRVNVWELNQLRREITNKLLSPTAFLRDKVTEGTTRALMTVGSVLSDKVKGVVRGTVPIFEKYAAYVKGFDALLNRVSATQGPVATGARIGGAAVGGAIGGFFGGFPGFAAGVAGEEFARSTLGRTSAAVALKKLGIAAEKLSQSETAQLLNLLQKAGVSRLLNQ